jgi:glycosyltransferase involved in cell wall biosynthesis
MKILMGIRRDALAIGGGDVVQMQFTARELAKKGVEVEFTYGDESKIGNHDLLHIFNTTRIDDTYRLASAAKKRGIPYVVSTIWHSMEEMRRAYAKIYRFPFFPIWTYTALKEGMYARRNGGVLSAKGIIQYKAHVREVLSSAAAALPNSKAELHKIISETGVTPKQSFVIPNGCVVSSRQRAGLQERRTIVCAGRIEPRKNQLSVANAFLAFSADNKEVGLSFYGAPGATGKRYFTRFTRMVESNKSIQYHGSVSQDVLFAAYREARVVVLASYFETTGLAILEALAQGCSAVILDSPYTREYFGDSVEYCDPYCEKSMTTAMQRAWERGPQKHAELLKKYSWHEAGRLTFEAYQAILRS